jgi:hypothetical protein
MVLMLLPYHCRYLLPDRSKVALQKTPVVKRDCNPKWQHELVFRDVSIAQLQNERCLELTVWNQGSASDCLGGVRIGLGTSAKTLNVSYLKNSFLIITSLKSYLITSNARF